MPSWSAWIDVAAASGQMEAAGEHAWRQILMKVDAGDELRLSLASVHDLDVQLMAMLIHATTANVGVCDDIGTLPFCRQQEEGTAPMA